MNHSKPNTTVYYNMCMNYFRPPPILICSVYSAAILRKVIVNCSNNANESENTHIHTIPETLNSALEKKSMLDGKHVKL